MKKLKTQKQYLEKYQQTKRASSIVKRAKTKAKQEEQKDESRYSKNPGKINNRLMQSREKSKTYYLHKRRINQ